MARKRRTQADVTADVPMTPMIDVVFQLLIYFLFTIKPIDVVAHLDVFRPAAEQRPDDAPPPPKMLQIRVLPEGFVLNERFMDLKAMTSVLQKLAESSKTQTVLILCSRESAHEKLVQVLDRCAEAGLTNLSVVSID